MAVAVVQAGSCSSDSTSSLGTSIRCRCGPKKTKKQKELDCRVWGASEAWVQSVAQHRVKELAVWQLWCHHICSLDSIPGLGVSICSRCGHKTKKKKKKKFKYSESKKQDMDKNGLSDSTHPTSKVQGQAPLVCGERNPGGAGGWGQERKWEGAFGRLVRVRPSGSLLFYFSSIYLFAF